MKWVLRLIDRLTSNKPTTRPAPRRRAPVLEHLEDRLQPSVSSIASNFNGTAIHAGATIWFNSVFKVSGLGAKPVTLNVINAAIDFTVGATSYHLSVPNTTITFSPSTTSATTTFNTATHNWVTNLPSSGLAGNDFLSGLAYTVPSGGLPGGIKPVTWSADFSTDTAGVSMQWQWAAAVYNSFSSDYNALGVKPVDDNHASQYQNSDHAGTPENYTIPGILPGGATGGGGSNWSGSYSGTRQVTPNVDAPTSSLSGYVYDDTLDNDGIKQADEPGLAGVAVTITGVTSTGASVHITVYTDSNGYYNFTGLAAGVYSISEIPPVGYVNGIAAAGSLGGTGSVGLGQITTINLGAGVIGTDYDFGELVGLPNS
jgi:hypothetical protein